jgi:hypothetical protein
MSCRSLTFPGGAAACQDYTGSGYNPSVFDPTGSGTYACSVPGASGGTPAIGVYCDQTGKVGTCQIGAGSAQEINLYFYGGPPAILESNCVNYMHGTWIGAGGGGGGGSTDTLPVQAKDALVSDELVVVTPNAASLTDVAAVVAARGAITFSPAQGAVEGLLIYPGGSVDPRAYAVAARLIAEQGIFVAIVPFPGNLAITDPMRGLGIMMSNPMIQTWAIAGHSLGGVAASILSAANPMGKIKGVAFWASYPAPAMGPGTVAADLSASALKIVSLTADQDLVLNQANYAATKVLLPATTRYASIRGGNHAQFGYYGAQSGDGTPKISAALQHELLVGATVQMFNRIGLSAADDVVSPIYAALADVDSKLCQTAQFLVAGFKGRDLNVQDVRVTTHALESDFVSSKPEFPIDGSALVSATVHAHQIVSPDNVNAPAIMDGEMWCKMKSQAAIAAQYGFTPKHVGRSCKEVNELIFAKALTMVDWRTALKFFFSGADLDFIDDQAAMMGPEWLANEVVLAEGDEEGDYTLQASKMEAPLFVPPPYGGAYYCKVWSTEAAVKFILENQVSCH